MSTLPQSGRAGWRFRHQVQHVQRRPGKGEGNRGDFCKQQADSDYRISDSQDVALDILGVHTLGGMTVEVINAVTDYAELVATLFDFNAIRGFLPAGSA